jgi:predicted ATPase/transcriptional regulator with XRE-family HTH domain
MSDIISLGLWIKRRRKALDLTQAELAQRISCSLELIQKIESDARRPSRDIAARLAEQLALAGDERTQFIQVARMELGADRLAPPAQSIARGAFVPAPAVPSDGATANEQPVTPRTNLPTPLTALIGRAHEIEHVCALLCTPATRLVTLTGPGGTGKTRLALHIGAQLLDDFPDGVWLVELARLADPVLVPQSIAEVLDVREEPGRQLSITLSAALREKQLLLLLDNCEHVIEACAQIVDSLLQGCPQLHILTSSREALGIAGETSIRVPPLAVPNPRDLPTMNQLIDYEAVRLFVERALAVQPEFRVTLENAPVVAQVCQRLDGIPLAIELAAAQVRVLAVAQIAARLNDRFRLLTGGSRTALPRQQTLQALIDWSYDLLNEDEQALLRVLTVFAGGWTLEAAEAVCARDGAGDVLDLITQLVDKSLVQVEQRGELARYHLLETIRQYGVEKLAASGQADDIRLSHALYFLALAEAAPPEFGGPRRTAWHAQLVAEYDNLRAALGWAVEQPGDDIAVRLAGALGWFWYSLGAWNEGRTWLQRALLPGGGAERSAAYGWLLFMQGVLASLQGEITGAQAALEESLVLFRDLHNNTGYLTAHFYMAVAAREQGDAARAMALFEEQLQIAREQGNAENVAWAQTSLGEVAVRCEDALRAIELLEPSLAYFRAYSVANGVAWTLNHLGHVAQLQNNCERALALHQESLLLFQKIDILSGIAWALESLGEVALAQGDLEAATADFTESLRIFQQMGEPGIIWSLAGLGSVAALGGQPERAARLWSAVEALREISGKRVAPASRATYERAVATAHVQLEADAFAAAWAAGRMMTQEQALAYALEQTPEAHVSRSGSPGIG